MWGTRNGSNWVYSFLSSISPGCFPSFYARNASTWLVFRFLDSELTEDLQSFSICSLFLISYCVACLNSIKKSIELPNKVATKRIVSVFHSVFLYCPLKVFLHCVCVCVGGGDSGSSVVRSMMDKKCPEHLIFGTFKLCLMNDMWISPSRELSKQLYFKYLVSEVSSSRPWKYCSS